VSYPAFKRTTVYSFHSRLRGLFRGCGIFHLVSCRLHQCRNVPDGICSWKGLKSRGSIAMLCAIVSLYASSLTLWALDVTRWVQDTHIAFMSNSTIPLPDRKGLVNGNLHGLVIQQAALYLFNVRVTSLNSMSFSFQYSRDLRWWSQTVLSFGAHGSSTHEHSGWSLSPVSCLS
jgi:hypothetical protein